MKVYDNSFNSWINMKDIVSEWVDIFLNYMNVRPWPPTSISEPNKVHQFQFQASGIFLFTCVQKLYGPEDFTIFTVHATIFG